jgi:hypothetical protein
VGHVQAEERGEKGEEKEDDDARDALDDNDGRGLDKGPRVARTVPDADDVAAEARGQEVVEERPDEVGPYQEAQRDVVAQGPGEDLPAVGAGEIPDGVEGKGQGEPGEADLA